MYIYLKLLVAGPPDVITLSMLGDFGIKLEFDSRGFVFDIWMM